jgi:hypothetical protein
LEIAALTPRNYRESDVSPDIRPVVVVEMEVLSNGMMR